MKKSLLILGLIGCLISCDEKEEKPIFSNVVTYPMTVGCGQPMGWVRSSEMLTLKAFKMQ